MTMSALTELRAKKNNTKIEEAILICGEVVGYVGEAAAAELVGLNELLDKAIAWHEGEDSPHAELEAQLSALTERAENAERLLAELREAAQDALDTARTMLIPDAFGYMTPGDWAQHKLNRISGMLDYALNPEPKP
jgi:proteasome assembly chaperone (PAC2) family protein